MRAYYGEILSGKVRNADQFERKYTNVKELLAGYGIHVDEDAVMSEDDAQSEAFLDTVSRFRSSLPRERHPDSLEHDVFLMTLIRERRGARDRGAAAVKVWLLTYDRMLMRFSVREATDAQLPPCLLADDWLQIARPFLPRTDDYDRSFIAMLRHPLAFTGPATVPLADMAQALHRLDSVRDTPAAVLGAMVSDAAVLERVRHARDDAEVIALIDSEAVRYANRLEEEKQRMAQQNRELVERVEQVERIVGAMNDRLAASGTAIEELTRARDEATDALSNVTGALPRQLEEAHAKGAADAEVRLEGRLDAAVTAALVAREITARTRRRKWLWYTLASLVTAMTIGMMYWFPGARSGFGPIVWIAILMTTWYTAAIYARHGMSHENRGRLADFTGIVAFLLVILQLVIGEISVRPGPGSASGDAAGRAPTGGGGFPAGQPASPVPESKQSAKADSTARRL
ncbi:MAG: hypothetical protein ACYCVL_02380 [Gemmatimonadaceae bacterium]